MIRAWRRLVLAVAAVALAFVVVGIGVVLWLYTSGRLTTLATALVQQLSGQEVTIGSLTFPSLGMAVLTEVRLQTELPGWHVEVRCPRMEARVGWWGLLKQRITHLHLQNLQVVLQARDNPATTTAAAPRAWPVIGPLPIARLTASHSQVQIQWPHERYAVQSLDIQLRQQGTQELLVEIAGAVEGSSATVLGTLSGSGVWHWTEHEVRKLHLQLLPTNIATLWQHLARQLPAEYQAWQMAGQTQVMFRCPRVSLRSPWHLQDLEMVWQLQDGAINAGSMAAEHLHGTLQTTGSLDAHQYALQGTLTLQPFALLLGSFFPNLEANRIAPVLTYTATYDVRPALLRFQGMGHFDPLGTTTIAATVHRPFGTPHYEGSVGLSNVPAEQVWRTFVHDTSLLPRLAPATVQGTLEAQLQLQGQFPAATIGGKVTIRDFSFAMADIGLQRLSLSLPVTGAYPFPPTVPEVTALPEVAYGDLRIQHLRFGGIEVAGLATKLVLLSDNLWVPEAIHLGLGGGQITLGPLHAWHLLQPQRQVRFSLWLQDIDLQQLQRGTDTLPLVGMVHGDLPRVQLQGEQLETDGVLTVALAGGSIRISDLHGRGLFSALPTLHCSLATDAPLSLTQLTQLYPIGEMSGSLEMTVTDLTWVAGELEAFQLRFAVREEGEPHVITLRALNNLLSTTGSAQIAAGLFGIGDTYRLPYRHFGVLARLRNDILQLRGLYHDEDGKEYFMQAPPLGHGVSIVNQVPENGIAFRDFLQRLRATALERPEVQLHK
jgi:hypothetical protein